MKSIGLLCALMAIGWSGAMPLSGHGCDHHQRHYSEVCRDCDHQVRRSAPYRDSLQSVRPLDVRTIEGTISEVIYLPRNGPENTMVEIRLQSAGESTIVRLGPTSFLRTGGMRLKEGDSIAVKGFPVSDMESDFVVAVEIRHGDRTLTLRDSRGRPRW
jgi:hypothetical protein